MIANTYETSGLRQCGKVVLWSTTSLSLALIINGMSAIDEASAQQVVAPGTERNLSEGEEVRYEGTADLTAITVQNGAILTGTGAIISTSGVGLGSGDLSAGIRAEANSTVNLTGGSVTATGTAYTRGILGYDSASVTTNGTAISTSGNNSHAVHVTSNAEATVQGGTVSTLGSDSFGLYSQNTGSLLTAQDVTVQTGGLNGFGAFAYGGGLLRLINGSVTTSGVQGHGAVSGLNSSIVLDGTLIETSGNQAHGLVADQTNASIDARGITIVTEGTGSVGLVAGSEAGPTTPSARISVIDSSVTARGVNADAARVSNGGALTSQNSTLVSTQSAGVVLNGNATATLDSTRVSAANETFVSNFNAAGQTQQITVSGASVATQNNGTLLRTERTVAGGDGVVQLVLGNGSTTSGDIIDESANKTTGGTDVNVEEGASWTGLLLGVRNFVGGAGGDVSFEGEANIEGDLTGNGTNFTFSDQGGQIGGDVTLTNGSQTAGGTIQNRINVAGNVGVDDSSVFGGNWYIEGNLTNAGRLTPGNSIGRVTVLGDLNLSSTSVYDVEIDATGNADLIDVGGIAMLGGTVIVTPLDGFLLGSPYTILTASGGFGGTAFDSVGFSQTYAFVDALLTYDPNAVLVTIERNNVAFASVALTDNQAAVAGALDQFAVTDPLVGAVALTAIEEARSAFDQLSGEIHASVQTALIEDSRHIRNAANNRLRATSVAGDMGMWGTAFGSWGSVDDNGNSAELSYSTGGLVVGADGMVTDTWQLGALLGYSASSYDIDDRASSGDSDNLHIGIYGGTQWGGLNVRTGLAYTWSDIDTQRSVAFAGLSDDLSAGYEADTFQAFGELGYSIEAGSAVLEPFVNLAHVHVRRDGFTEEGGAAALTSGRSTTDTTFTTFGLRAETDLPLGDTVATARGMIGWRHAFGDVTPYADHMFDGGIGSFAVAGAPVAKDVAVIEAGLDFSLSPTATLGLSYEGQIGSGASDHGGHIGLNIRF